MIGLIGEGERWDEDVLFCITLLSSVDSWDFGFWRTMPYRANVHFTQNYNTLSGVEPNEEKKQSTSVNCFGCENHTYHNE